MPDYFDVAIYYDKRDPAIGSFFSDYSEGKAHWCCFNKRMIEYFRNVPAKEIEECIELRDGVHKFCIETQNTLTLTSDSQLISQSEH